jgi:hypothetical protein
VKYNIMKVVFCEAMFFIDVNFPGSVDIYLRDVHGFFYRNPCFRLNTAYKLSNM